MNYNQPVTIITKRPISNQTYTNTVFIQDKDPQINTEFIMLLEEFDYINEHVLSNLIEIMVSNRHIDGIYGDLLFDNNGIKTIHTNVAYNLLLIKQFPPFGPIFFKSTFQNIESLHSNGFLLHIPRVLFYNGKTGT